MTALTVITMNAMCCKRLRRLTALPKSKPDLKYVNSVEYNM